MEINKKLKVLVLSDHALSTSGVGTQTRHLLNGLISKGCWSFRQFGAAMKHTDSIISTCCRNMPHSHTVVMKSDV